MITYKHAAEKAQRLNRNAVSKTTLDEIVNGYLTCMMKYVYQTATLVKRYRAAYGYSIANPDVFHAAAVSLFILLSEISTRGGETRREGAWPRCDSLQITDADSAFEECFHCLLACGVQQTLPRGIARMAYHTARELKVQLPETVVRLLDVASDVMWRTSDIALVDSMYPNLAIETYSDLETREHGLRMSNLLRKWEVLERNKVLP